jgi:hypothetical protein
MSRCSIRLRIIRARTTGTIVTNLGGGVLDSVLADFRIFPLLLLDGSDSGCSGSSCVRMAMVWDSQIVQSSGQGELLTISYVFRDSSGSNGSCSFSVKPDLSFN